MRFIGLGIILLLLSLNMVTAQDVEQTEIIFAGVKNGQPTIFTYVPDVGIIHEETIANSPSGAEFDNLSWSPDGRILSFSQDINPRREFEPPRTEFILAPYLEDHQPFLIETSLSRDLQVFFSPKFSRNSYLTYVIRPPADNIHQGEDFSGILLDVYRRYYIAGRSEQIGQIVYGFGCGHTPSTPMEALQDAEGALKSLILETEYGVLFSPFCFGRGLALSTDETFELLHANLKLAVHAPDYENVAGWDTSTSTIVQYNLESRTTHECTIEDEVTQLAYVPDNTALYYATRYPQGQLDLSDDNYETLSEIMSLSEHILARYGVRIYRMTLETCQAEMLYENPDAYAISRILPMPDYLLFSEIENGDAWLEQMLADGERDFTREQQHRDIVAVTLYGLQIGQEDAQVIAQGIEKVTVRVRQNR